MGLNDFCKDLERINNEDLTYLALHATPPQSHSDSDSESLLTWLAADGFLIRDILDTSLDFFFQYFPMPFIHKATFNARTTPGLLLFPICLIGFSLLYPEHSKPFILRHLRVLRT